MKLFLIGDSISIHYGNALEKYLLDANVEFMRKGGLRREGTPYLEIGNDANGGNSAEVLLYLQNRLASDPVDADLVLVNCGLHDIKTHIATGEKEVGIESYRQNLEAIIALITGDMKARMAWIRTTPCDDKIHNRPGMPFHRHLADINAYNSVADSCMAVHAIPEIDLFTFTQSLGPSEELYFDHIHFTDEVKRAQAGYIAGWIDAWRNLNK